VRRIGIETLDLMKLPVRLPLTSLMLLLLVPWYTACESASSEMFPVTVRSHSDNGQPLEGLRVEIDGAPRGTTDATGRLLIEAYGKVGDIVSVFGRCPEGYRGPSVARQVTLRRFDRLDRRGSAFGPEISWHCGPLKRDVAVVVRASGQPALPIVVQGQRVGVTDDNGFAHVLLRRRPGGDLRVLLDTTNNLDLRPQNPVKIFRIEDRDAIFVFDQDFEKKRRVPKKPRKKKTRRHVPIRIG
jgi:hypothetical protein